MTTVEQTPAVKAVIAQLLVAQRMLAGAWETANLQFQRTIAVEGYSMDLAQLLLDEMDAHGAMQARISGVLADLVCSELDSRQRADALLSGLRLLKDIEVAG